MAGRLAGLVAVLTSCRTSELTIPRRAARMCIRVRSDEFIKVGRSAVVIWMICRSSSWIRQLQLCYRARMHGTTVLDNQFKNRLLMPVSCMTCSNVLIYFAIECRRFVDCCEHSLLIICRRFFKHSQIIHLWPIFCVNLTFQTHPYLVDTYTYVSIWKLDSVTQCGLQSWGVPQVIDFRASMTCLWRTATRSCCMLMYTTLMRYAHGAALHTRSWLIMPHSHF